MKIRRLTSLKATLDFVLMLVTSIILFIAPQGRVAYWADWRLWGLTKTDWGNIHINLGLLFLIALSVHIYYNWKPLISYLRNKAKQIKLFTPEFKLACVITIVFIFGSYFLVPPFGWVMSLNEHFKDAGAEKYGEPPYGHAELSTLNAFAKKMDIDPVASLQRLQRAGLQVTDGKQTLQALAAINKTTPKALYAVMAAIEEQADSGNKGLPDSPPPGTGRLTLAEFCSTYGLDPQELLAALKIKNISAEASESLRNIAERHGMGPVDLYEVVKAAADALRKAG